MTHTATLEDSLENGDNMCNECYNVLQRFSQGAMGAQSMTFRSRWKDRAELNLILATSLWKHRLGAGCHARGRRADGKLIKPRKACSGLQLWRWQSGEFPGRHNLQDMVLVDGLCGVWEKETVLVCFSCFQLYL